MPDTSLPPLPEIKRGDLVIVKDRGCWSRDRKCVVFKVISPSGILGVCTTDGLVSYAKPEYVERDNG